MRWVIGCLLALAPAAGAEPLLEGRVLLSSGAPAAGARVRLFADLERSLRATADESGYFAFPLNALRKAAPLPARLHLGQNYPNPFNPSTIIPYQLPAATRVRLEVFNILGQRVATLVDGERPAGFHTAAWNATDASGRGVGSGVYLYRLLGGGERLTRSMVLLDGAVGLGGGGGSARAAAPPRGKGPVYGLTVSGPGLVPYVDPAFRMGGGPVEIQVQPLSSLPRGKVAAGGLLGDVNRDGRVDLADALLVASYSEDPTLSLANGDLTLGDVNRDGQVDLADARLIEAYHADPSDASLPEGIGAPVGAEARLYWTDADGDRIQRSFLDGSGVEDVVDSGLVNPRGLAVDQAAGKLYWTDYGSDRIQRSNLDGSEVEDLVTTGLRIPLGLALDTVAGKLYWTDNGSDKIQRSNLDGSEVEDLVTGLQTPLSLALDAAAGKLYWTDSGTDKIQRANLDGSEIEDLVATGLELPRGLAVDAAGGKLYWTDNGSDQIQRANLDGSQVEELVREGLHTPRGLALDPEAGKLYWTDSGTGKIQRANLDGTEIEDLVTEGLLSPRGLVLVRTVAPGNQAPVLAPIADRTAAAGDTLTLVAAGSDPDGDTLTYTASSGNEAVVSVEIADSLVTVYALSAGGATITATVRDPEGLEAVQTFSVLVGAGGLGAVNRLYWTDAEADRIQRANLDGSAVEDVIDSGLVNPRGLAVDEAAGKLYWTDYGSDRIQRSNLDGTEVEDLVTAGLQIPLALALDAAAGKLYWTDNGTNRIQRSNLDGSEVEDLVTGLQTPLGLALDQAGGKLYWTDSGADKIQRANLDGTEIEDLVTAGLQIPRGLALDTAGGKLYWADSGTDRIQRANLDGTEIEDLVTTGLGTPRGLALDVSAGKLYWADSSTDRIQRSNLDGSEIEDLVTEGLLSPRGLALARIPSADNQAPTLEPLADRMAATGDSLTLELAGSDPDGDALTYTASSSQEEIATAEAADSLVTLRLLSVGQTAITVTAGDPGGLQASRTFTVTVQASNEPPLAIPWLYWTDARTDRIQRAELDGSGIRTLVSGLGQPRDIALDRDGGRMYWTDSGSDKIQRAHLDGSKVEDLVTEGLKEPFGIALDKAGGKIYWSDWGTDKIQRSNLDGSEIEDLVATGLNEPYGLALDLGEGKIYWTDWGSDRIQRANLDGSQIEDLVIGLNQPRGLALDLEGGRMYWPDWGTDKIQRANLDGSEVEDLVTEGLRTSQAIALDLDEGRMYWTDYGTDKIQRANLDGSQVEDLVTSGLKEPYGLALGAGLPAQVFKVEGDSATLNLAGRFRDPEGGVLTLTVSSSDEGVAAATLADSVVTIAPVTPGRVTVSVTARDEGGRAATLPVPVTVYPANRPPVAQTLGDRKIRIDRPARVDLSTAFTDPDEGDVLTYTAMSSNEAVATAAVEGSGVNIAPKSLGQTTIAVTARDPEGLEASLSFGVTVEPKPPPRPPRPPSGSGSDDNGNGNSNDGGGPAPPPQPPPPPPGQNNAPTFDEAPAPTRTVAENTPANRNIQHPVRATDPDGHRLTYRLAGPDETRFTVVSSSGQLRTRSGVAYDFEVKDRYEVRLESDDTYGGTDAIDVTVHVADVDEPPQTPARPRVEPGDSKSLTVTWTEPANTGPEVDGYDVQYRTGSGSFLPWTHDGDGTTATITGLDVNTRYEVQVRATNDEGTGAWSSSGRGATSTNQRPIFDEGGSATRSLAENTPGGQDVGNPIRAADPEGGALTYRLTGGDTDQFTIDSSNGQLRTRTGVDYDYEAQNRYSVTVEAQDEQGGRATIAVTIDINDDDNERPERPDRPSVTASTLTSLTLRWTEPANPGPPITDYNVQYREGSSGAFTAAAHDGTGTTTTIANLESDTSYEIQVQATSDEGTSQWSPSGNGRTVANQAPTFNEGSRTTRRLAENTTGTQDIGNPVTATDGDGGTLLYHLEGTDRASFTLDVNQLQTIAGVTYDYEEKSSYEVTVRVEDGQGGSNTIEVTINLIDQQEPPETPSAPGVSAASSTSLTVTWIEPTNTGPDVDDYDLQYREGDSGGFTSWTHNGADLTATITGLTPGANYEAQVRASNDEGTSDWSPSGTGNTSANEPPVFTDGSSATRALDENTTGVVDVGDPVGATDPENTTLAYSLQGADADSFTVHSSSGQLRTRSGKTWDYETTSNYSVSVKATDGHGGERTIPVFVELNDLNEPPSFTSDAAFQAAENQTFAGRVTAQDLDSGDNIATYTVTGGADQNLFEVNSAGTLTFKDAPDFENPSDAGRNNQYNVAVTATGGTGGRALTSEQAITVTVTDENEPPVFTSDDAFKVDENEQIVGRVIATDVDRDDGITGYEITGGADEDEFEIAGTNQLRFKDDPDFERPADSGGDNEYLVEVTATGGTDTRVMTGTQTITVAIEDEVEPPGKPDPPAVSDETESSLTVTWTEPANTGPVITNYHVQYREGTSGPFTDWPDTGPTLTRTITGLRSGQTYQVQVQAKNDEGEGAWSNAGSGRTLTAPTVSSVAFTSTPPSGQNNTYKKDDVIGVTVTFSEAVTVTGTPQVDLTLGSTVRQAGYESGSTTTQLLFQYEVQADDEDDNGAAINENGLKLNSGRIFLLKNSVTVNADLAHSAVANQSRHKVDGVAPTPTKAEVDGTKLTLTYGETLVSNPKPANSDFEVTVDSETRSVTAVAVSNTKVTLTLASAVNTGETVALAYTPGTNPIRDRARNPAGALSNLAVDNLRNVCNRTAQVRDEIMDEAGVSACGDVTADHLAAITRLSLIDESISTLKAGDFAGLTSLEELYLSDNSISSLPAGIFSGLSALEDLSLRQNNLSNLGANTFSGLTALVSLDLSFSHLGDFDPGLFSGLASLTHLNLLSARINNLPANGFSALTALDTLILQYNLLGDLDANEFSGLSTLEYLDLSNTRITSLPADVFSGLSSLKHLDMEYARLSSLPATVFSGLSSLEHLNVKRNDLPSLDPGQFSGLTALIHLDISSIDLTSVHADLFSGLTELEFLDLSYNNNHLTTLSATVFSEQTKLRTLSLRTNDISTLDSLFVGLTELRSLDLRQMDLSTLGDSVFSGLTELTRLQLQWNPVDPLPITVSLESAETDQFRAKAHTGAPFDVVLPLRLSNGEIDGGESSITIPQGSVESEPLSVSRTAGTRAAVTVDLGTLPALPSGDNGYELVRSADLPLVVIAAEKGVEIYPTELTLPEDDSDTYTVVLTMEPTADVTVTVTVPSGADVTVNPSPLTFTTDNWDTPQTVTVSTSADTDTDDDEVTLTHTVSGGGYQGVTADDVEVTVTETAVSTNSPPSIFHNSWTVDENFSGHISIVGTDPDDRDYITGYEITGGRDRALFEIATRGGRGELTFVDVPDFERPAGTSNRNEIVVTVTSGMGARKRTGQRQIAINVNDVDEPPGRPPAPGLSLPGGSPTIAVSMGGRIPPVNTGPDISGWGIGYREKDSGDFITSTHTSSTLDARIDNLTKGVTYEVQVQAKNDEGDSEWSPSAEKELPNKPPVVVGSFDDLTLAVGGAVEIVSADGVFSSQDGDLLTYSASSGNTAAATVQLIGTKVLVDPGSAGSATITVTASDPYGASDSETFDVTVQTPTLSAPTLTITGNLFTLSFTDDFAAEETRAYHVRIRQKTNHGPWATGCHTETNDEDSQQSISVSLEDAVSDFFEPGTTYEADYGYLGADCDGSLTGSRSATGEVTTSGTASFDIDLVFVGSISSTNRSHIEDAVERWEEIITGDLPNHQLTSRNREYLNRRYPGTTAPEVVDDIVIYVRTGYVLGLAAATSLSHRTPSSLPFASEIVLGTSNVINYLVALHEIGHALGFGTYPWTAHNLLKDPSRGPFSTIITPSPDTYFSGAKAVAAFDAAGGTSYTGTKVPVENGSSTRYRPSLDSHWRQSVIQSELMTPGFSDPGPLSAITIQSMADLGYTVDVTQADAYTLPSSITAKRVAWAGGDDKEEAVLLNCVLDHHETGPEEPEPITLNLRRVGRRE